MKRVRIFHWPEKAVRIVRMWLKRVALRCRGVSFGRALTIRGRLSVKLQEAATLCIGDDVTFFADSKCNPLCQGKENSLFVMRGAQLRIGDGSGISSACIWAKESVLIGKRVRIGAGSIILDNDCHSMDHEIRAGLKTDSQGRSDVESAASAPVTIGDDVLIGANCIILKGVSIGARSIIGAGSVVTRPIPADCIAAGNPCTVLKRKEVPQS